jgi:hypothetical protein
MARSFPHTITLSETLGLYSVGIKMRSPAGRLGAPDVPASVVSVILVHHTRVFCSVH